VADVIGRWRIEGRWWADGRDREYWRVEARGGAVWDLYHDRQRDRWHMERLWD
jgi:ribosomal silencing factor RsfS